MNFYIRYVKLWFKRNNDSEQYEFFPDKVNVITGDSSTGKSSLLRIIDYCLLSADSMIVEDVINENTLWYGLSFHLNDHDYIVIRKGPTIETEDASIYWKEDASEFPNQFVPNMRVGDLTVIMNQLFHIPETTLNVKDRNIHLSFRHFLVLNYLTEDIIATVNTYFDTRFFMSPEYEDVLDNVFRLAIGIDDSLEYQLENSLKNKRADLSTFREKGESARRRNQNFDKTVDEIWKALYDLGLITAMSYTGREQAFSDINEAFDKFNKTFVNRLNTNEVEELKRKKAEFEKQLAVYISLQKEYQRYLNIKECQKDSLIPIQYIRQHLNEVIQYHDTKLLIDKLNASLESISRISQRAELPMSIADDTQRLQQELQNINLTKVSHPLLQGIC